jgi:cytochrome c peroxidase
MWLAFAILGLDLFMPIPEENPMTRAKAELGRRLFHDRRLSLDGRISCATCHDPKRAFSDGRTVARGIESQVGTRNVPALINRGYGKVFFWDGRAASLEQQALQPILSRSEMGLTEGELLTRLERNGSYRRAFRAAFAENISLRNVSHALASFVRSIRSGDSRFDRYLFGDTKAFTQQERYGLSLFRGKANCWQCHSGPNLSDESFHNTGVAFRDGRLLDEGRFAVTSKSADRGAFKTPTLREISRTAPYMHDGSFSTIEEVIEYYDRGGNKNDTLDPAVVPLRLSHSEKQALAAFLRTLNGTVHQ